MDDESYRYVYEPIMTKVWNRKRCCWLSCASGSGIVSSPTAAGLVGVHTYGTGFPIHRMPLWAGRGWLLGYAQRASRRACGGHTDRLHRHCGPFFKFWSSVQSNSSMMSWQSFVSQPLCLTWSPCCCPK